MMTRSTTIHIYAAPNVQREIDQNFESVACNSSKALIHSDQCRIDHEITADTRPD
jgi:hypothetical protein